MTTATPTPTPRANLKAAIKRHGSQRAVAAATGIERATINRYVHGLRITDAHAALIQKAAA